MTGLVEKEYSKALFEISQENGTTDSVLSELSFISAIFSEYTDLVRLLSASTLSSDEKHDIVSKIFSGKFSETTYNFLNVVVDNGRISRINDIIDSYRNLYNDVNGILEVTAITTESMSDVVRNKLVDKLTKISSKKITLVEKTDKDILGGIILNYGNTQLDASVKSKLDGMRSKIDSLIA